MKSPAGTKEGNPTPWQEELDDLMVISVPPDKSAQNLGEKEKTP